MALSIGVVSFGLPSPIYGILVARLGPRFTLIWGNLLAGLAIAGLAWVQQVWQVYALYAIIGLGGGFGGYIACSTVATNWFVKRRSLALGLFTACGGLGGFVFPPITTALIEGIGWRMSWLVLAAVVLLIGVLLGSTVLIRNRPEDMGLVPDGIPAGPFEAEPGPTTLPEAGEPPGGGQLRQIAREPIVWLIAAFAAANAFALGTMSTHQVAYLEDIGFFPMTAATTVSLMSAMNVVGAVTLGALALRLNVKYLAMAGFASELVAVTILLITRDLGLIYVYAIFQGIGNGSLMATMPTFVGLHFHGQRYAKALGIILPFQVGFQAVAAFVGGAIYDATQSYRPAFFVVAAFIILGFIVISMTRLPKR